MKKIVSDSLKAWFLTATLWINSSTLTVDKSWTEITQDFKEKVWEVLNYWKMIKDFSVLESKKEVKESKEVRIFPKETVSIWMQKMSNSILENIKYNGLDIINPPFVDIWWFERVYCAWTIKWFIWSLKESKDKTENENLYLNRIWIDAWQLPDEFTKRWLYEQKIDLMSTFDKRKIWNQNIIKDISWYNNQVIEVDNFLRDNNPVWALLFIYFNYSNYKSVVRDYNIPKINSKQKLSINTHQAMFIWNSFMEFKAWEVGSIKNNSIVEFIDNKDIVEFIIDFIQKRSWYKWWLADYTRDIIKNNLISLHSNVWEIEVNWKKIDFSIEYKKNPKNRLKIQKEDIIKLNGPILIDWFHDANNENKFISKHNHLRTKLFFELSLIWTYTMSELMTPTPELLNIQLEKNQYDDIRNNVKVKHVYHLNEWETIELKLKESILRFDFWYNKEINYSKDEIELFNKIAWVNKAQWLKLTYELIKLREKKINKIINELSPQDKLKFNKNYWLQIKWLQLFWYIQTESRNNIGTTKTNAPIMFFDYEWLEKNFLNYIDLKKQELEKLETIDLENDNNIEIYFFPWDNFWKIFSQINSSLLKFKNRYPDFEKIQNLDLLQKNKLIDIIIDKYSKNSKIDVTKWKVPSYESIRLNLDFVNSVLNWILQESYIHEVELTPTDKIILDNISLNKQYYDLLAHILVKESYERWVPVRKITKEIWEKLWETSSYWDFQMRLNNLKNINTALIRFPSANDLKQAIKLLDKPVFREIIERRKLRFWEQIENDLLLVDKILEEINYIDIYNDERRLEAWKKVNEYLREIFKFNWEKQINIVWKIIQTRLIQTKIDEHYYNINSWLERSNEDIDKIIHDNNLQNRYRKLILVVNNRSEKTALIWCLENYILRFLDSKWINTSWENFPKLELNWKWQIKYSSEEINQRFSFYEEIVSKNTDNKEVLNMLNEIIKSNYSAENIYKFFTNKEIKNQLKSAWFDTSLLPTIEEYYGKWFRNIFFDYQKTPIWRKPPETFLKNIEEQIKYYILIFGVIFAWLNLNNFKKYFNNKK